MPTFRGLKCCKCGNVDPTLASEHRCPKCGHLMEKIRVVADATGKPSYVSEGCDACKYEITQ